MKNYNDFMIDFEAFGTSKDCAICQVGVCSFDRKTGEIGETLKINIDAASHTKNGGKLDADTVYWWLNQSKEAQNSILADPKMDIKEAFLQLNDFLKDAKHIWCHTTYDFTLLTETLKQLDITPSFSYKVARDLRTVVDLGKVTIHKLVREGTHHDALDDCKFQVKYCVEALNNILNMKKLNKVLNQED